MSGADRWRLGLGTAAAAGLAYLVFGEKPWEVVFDEKHRVERFVAYYVWLGVAAGVAVAGLLAWMSSWWAGRTVVSGAGLVAMPAWFWPVVGAAACFSAVTAAPRLGHGLWDDEELNVRMSIVGRYRLREGDEPLRFHEVGWEDAAFEYREPNNHPLNSLLAKACHGVWRAVAQPSGLPFTEWPLRVPAFLAAVGGVLSLGWFLRVLGWPVAGALAAWLMALHPWHLRYAAECRGYAFALLLAPLVFGFWHRAVFSGRWRWWAALGIAQLALVYAYPGSLVVLVVLHALALPVLALQSAGARPFVAQAGRWFCSNALSGVVALTLLLPLLAQVGPYVERQSEQGFAPGLPWLASAANHFLCGVAWWRGSTPETGYPEVVARMGAALPAYFLFAAAALAAVCAGCVRMVRCGPVGWSLVAATALPPFLKFGYAVGTTQIIYEPYVLYALPGLVGLAAAGVDAALGRLRLPWRLAGGLAAIGIFAWLVMPFRDWLIRKPLQPTRESVLASRGTLSPHDAASDHILTGSFCIPPYLYDPRMVRLDSTDELIALLRRADAESRPLVLNIGMPWAARAYSPGMWALANDRALFEPPQIFRGWDAGLDRMLFRYLPGSARSYDFANALLLPR